MDFDIKKCTPYSRSKNSEFEFYTHNEMKKIVKSYGIPSSGVKKAKLYDIMVKISEGEHYLKPDNKYERNLRKFEKMIRKERMWVKVGDVYFLSSSCYKEPKATRDNATHFYDKKKISDI